MGGEVQVCMPVRQLWTCLIHRIKTSPLLVDRLGYTPLIIVHRNLALDDDGVLDCPFVTGTFDESGYQTTDVLIEGGCTDATGKLGKAQ